MDSDQLKQRKTTPNETNVSNKSESGSGHGTNNEQIASATTSTASAASTAIQTKEDYFNALRTWLQQIQLQQMAYNYFPFYLSSNFQPQPTLNTSNIPPMPFYPPQYPMFQPYTQSTNQQNNTAAPQTGVDQQQQNPFARPPPPIFANNLFPPNRNNYVDNVRQNMDVIQLNGGYEYIIAPVWKRFVAETIDVIILFIIKLMIAFMIIDLLDVDLIDLDFDSIKTSLEEDYTDFLSFSSDLLLVEILTKVMVCFYEAMWTAQGQTFVGGATPGKILMGIRILYVEAVVPIGQLPNEPNLNGNGVQMRALLYPAANPGFRRALLRAIAKNMLMTLMFPMCFVLLFFRNNRTGYDVMTKTIVVEENPAPIRRQI